VALADTALQDRLHHEMMQRQMSDLSAAGMLASARILMRSLRELPGKQLVCQLQPAGGAKAFTR